MALASDALAIGELCPSAQVRKVAEVSFVGFHGTRLVVGTAPLLCLHEHHIERGSVVGAERGLGCARVQCKAYLAQPSELLTGLNLIHTTNLDYFTTQHQAEIFRLKGQFLQVRLRTPAPRIH